MKSLFIGGPLAGTYKDTGMEQQVTIEQAIAKTVDLDGPLGTVQIALPEFETHTYYLIFIDLKYQAKSLQGFRFRKMMVHQSIQNLETYLQLKRKSWGTILSKLQDTRLYQ